MLHDKNQCIFLFNNFFPKISTSKKEEKSNEFSLIKVVTFFPPLKNYRGRKKSNKNI